MDFRKLDALVAEKIMGWQVRWVNVKRYPAPYPKCKWGMGGWSNCPEFSHSMEDAWLVVEKMRAGGWHISICTPRPDSGVLVHMDDLKDRFQWTAVGHSVTAPLAICLAALKAQGVDTTEWEVA